MQALGKWPTFNSATVALTIERDGTLLYEIDYVMKTRMVSTTYPHPDFLGM